MIDPEKWKDEGVIFEPSQPTEDFVVDHTMTAWYVSGSGFHALRLHVARAASPRGPFLESRGFPSSHHTRLYRGRVDDKTMLVTAAFPNACALGIWCFTEWRDFYKKELIIRPEPPYSAVAGNPTHYREGQRDLEALPRCLPGRS